MISTRSCIPSLHIGVFRGVTGMALYNDVSAVGYAQVKVALGKLKQPKKKDSYQGEVMHLGQQNCLHSNTWEECT